MIEKLEVNQAIVNHLLKSETIFLSIISFLKIALSTGRDTLLKKNKRTN